MQPAPGSRPKWPFSGTNLNIGPNQGLSPPSGPMGPQQPYVQSMLPEELTKSAPMTVQSRSFAILAHFSPKPQVSFAPKGPPAGVSNTSQSPISMRFRRRGKCSGWCMAHLLPPHPNPTMMPHGTQTQDSPKWSQKVGWGSKLRSRSAILKTGSLVEHTAASAHGKTCMTYVRLFV